MADVLAIAIIVAFFAFSALVVRWLSRVVEDADANTAATDTGATDAAAAEADGELVPAGGAEDTGWRM
jgi:Na+-transporting methylmalonyl-CoA/oxaloacetate decarboxylase gamma subunit